ncbi:diguanylate cyclase [Sulfurimonas diazotrophicus]|uniref:diguanylate cyclase n=1 Tax=Sulfurimonas diazotrophicus TaxID=3131939 RepID=A0ABZ3HAC5_9BACT
MKASISVRVRILGTVVVFALVLFLLVQYQYEVKLKVILNAAEQSKYETVADTVLPVLAVNTAFELREENRQYMMELVEQNPDLVRIVLRTEQAGTIDAQVRQPPEGPEIRLQKVLPDPQGGSALGEVTFVFASRVLQMTEHEHRTFIVSFVLVAGALLMLLIVILHFAIRPLYVLLEWIQNFDPKTDDMSTMPEACCEEVRMIEESMQQMFERIRHYTSELDELNRHLDEKVRERTDELSWTNTQLQEEIRIRKAAEAALKSANERLKALSRLDVLTGIANRRSFQEHLTEHWSICVREHLPLSLIICDIDNFKRVNDTYGHPAGDVVIHTIAEILGSEIKRASDLVARYGGEEFAIILFNTGHEDALALVKRLQEKVWNMSELPSPAEAVRGVSLSFGYCSLVPGPADSISKCISAADEALYRAKKSGRNRIVYGGRDPA